MKTSKFTNLLLWGCLSGDVELLLQGDRMALPPRPRAALAVPGATRDEGDSGVGDTQLSSSSRADVCSSFVCSATSWFVKSMVGHHGVWAGSTRWNGLR